MGIGISLILIAIGAVLEWGINVVTGSNVNLDVIGWILMGVGAVGFLVSLVLLQNAEWRDRRDL